MTKSVLIVDDSPTMRILVRNALEDVLDLDIYESENGFQALKVLPTTKIDLIITDINMPQINGLELLQFVRSNEVYRDIPVIIITTEGQNKDRARGMSLGAAAYVIKPFDPDEMIAHCIACLERGTK